MGFVPSNCQWTGNKLRPVLVLFTRRSVTVKVLCVLLVFAILECMYKINFSLLDQLHGNMNNRRTGMDCRFPGNYAHFGILCSTNVSRFGNIRPTEESETALAILNHKQLQTMVNFTTIAPIDRSKPLIDLNMTTVLEDISLGSSPFPPTNPHPYKYISLPGDCRFHGNRTKILILMYSRPGNTIQRKMIRRTWGELRDPTIRLVFLLGFVEDVQYVIEDESDRYGDILQEDFHDSYTNNTITLIMGYNWAVKHCSTADVILSLDERLRVKSDILFEYIRDLVTGSPKRLFRGHVVPNKRHDGFGFIDNTTVSKSVNFNVNLVSRDVVNQFQMIFPYMKIRDVDVSGYMGNVADILSVKQSYDPYFDPDNPVSFFASPDKNVSRHLLSYPLNINLRRLVRQKVVYGKAISQQPINRKLLPLVHNATRCNVPTKRSAAGHFLVVIWSDAFDSEQRSAIREVWGYAHIATVRLVFVLGSVDIHQKDIDAENRKYGDIIQIAAEKDKFYDVIKTVATFSWIVQNCKNADFILFLDGNINVNISMTNNFMKELTKSNIKDVFFGHVVDEWKPDRRSGSLLYVSEKDYPYDQVPPYVIGLNYVMSFHIVRSFHIVFPLVKYCPVVDLYLGIVASKLMIIPKHDHHFDRRNQTSFLRGIP